jgi:hypothetical protein
MSVVCFLHGFLPFSKISKNNATLDLSELILEVTL